MRVVDSISINRPIDEVFALWADVEGYPRWADPVVERRKLTDGPVSVGTKFRAIDQWPGRRVEFEMEITEFVPNERLGARWSEPMEGEWSSELTETPDGTRLHFEIEMRLPLAMRLLSPIMKWWAKRANRKFMRSFKVWLESGHH